MMLSHVDFNTVFKVWKYPAGEPHVEALFIPRNKRPVIVADCKDWNDLVCVALADDILVRNECRAEWVIPCFPFSRHDRRRSSLDSMPLQAALALMKPVNPIVVDPHSEVAATFRHYTQADVVAEFFSAGIFNNDPIVVIPDAGAAKKAYSWISSYPPPVVAQAMKQRNTATGHLTGFSVDLANFEGRPAVIVDDICDGGGTFIGLADLLKAHGAGELTLAVSHGLFTKGLDELMNKFDRIFTLNTCKLTHDRLHLASLGNILERSNPL